jgi:hypothetical protein
MRWLLAAGWLVVVLSQVHQSPVGWYAGRTAGETG